MKNGTYSKIALLIIGLFFSICLRAQHFDSVLNRLDKEFPQEKLYLHFDRSIYNAGETVWLKAYLFTGTNLSLISKTLYVEMADDKGHIIQQVTSPLVKSSASASFDIPVNLQGDFIYIRAYTRWMLNFDSSYLYVKAIPLVSKKTITPKPVPVLTSLQFFPEGGDLVEGVSSRIAFKATGPHGLPVNVKGDIMDESGKKVTSFVSVHDGMGMFSLVTSSPGKFKAVWKDGNGPLHETPLPVAKKGGITLELNNTGAQLNFTVKRSPDDASPSNAEVYIVAQYQQQLVYRAKGKLAAGKGINASIPIDSLPAGIIQVTVFNGEEQPLAERIAFVNQQDYYFITDLNPSLINTSKRRKNVVQVDVPDTISCNLSIAITDADLNASGESQDNIFSHILMTGDIKGYIHNPGYYFSSEADSVVRHLDLVMMTNGWRRFNWEDVLADHWPVLKYQPENYLTITGKVYGIDKGLIRNKEVMGILQLKNKASEMMAATVEPDGSFIFENPIFYDTAQLFYQFNNDKNKDLTSRASFNLKNSFLAMSMGLQPQDAWLSGFSSKDTTVVKNKQASERFFNYFTQQRTKVLQTVVVKAKQKSKKQLMDEEYTSGLFTGGDDYTFITEDDPFANSSQTVLAYLQGKVAGLQVSLNGGSASLSWRGGTPSLFVNEMPSDVQSVQSVPHD